MFSHGFCKVLGTSLCSRFKEVASERNTEWKRFIYNIGIIQGLSDHIALLYVILVIKNESALCNSTMTLSSQKNLLHRFEFLNRYRACVFFIIGIHSMQG